MTDFRQVQRSGLWRDVLIAVLRANQPLRTALDEADRALEEYTSRFLPAADDQEDRTLTLLSRAHEEIKALQKPMLTFPESYQRGVDDAAAVLVRTFTELAQ